MGEGRRAVIEAALLRERGGLLDLRMVAKHIEDDVAEWERSREPTDAEVKTLMDLSPPPNAMNGWWAQRDWAVVMLRAARDLRYTGIHDNVGRPSFVAEVSENVERRLAEWERTREPTDADEIARLHDALDALAAMHSPSTDVRNVHCEGCGRIWPCATRQYVAAVALRAERDVKENTDGMG
jgi:hypothetical protein